MLISLSKFALSFLPPLSFDCYRILLLHKLLDESCPSLHQYHMLVVVHAFPFLLMPPSCSLQSHFMPPDQSLYVTRFIPWLQWGHSCDLLIKPSAISQSIRTSCLSLDVLNHHMSTDCCPFCAHSCLVHILIKYRFLLFQLWEFVLPDYITVVF